jgi:hypothetical protein
MTNSGVLYHKKIVCQCNRITPEKIVWLLNRKNRLRFVFTEKIVWLLDLFGSPFVLIPFFWETRS